MVSQTQADTNAINSEYVTYPPSCEICPVGRSLPGSEPVGVDGCTTCAALSDSREVAREAGLRALRGGSQDPAVRARGQAVTMAPERPKKPRAGREVSYPFREPPTARPSVHRPSETGWPAEGQPVVGTLAGRLRFPVLETRSSCAPSARVGII